MLRFNTPHIVAKSGREFSACLESYHTAKFCTVWQRVFRVCGEFHTTNWGTVWPRVYKMCVELSHRTYWHRLEESLLGVWSIIAPHSLAQSG